VNLHMVREIITPCKSFVAFLASMIPFPVMFLYVSLVVGFHRELNSALVADKWFETLVCSQVLLQ